MRCTEQGEHGEIGFRVASVRGRINEHRPRRSEEQVPRPQITVNPCRNKIPAVPSERSAGTFHEINRFRGDGSPSMGLTDERKYPLLRVEFRPIIRRITALGNGADVVRAAPRVPIRRRWAPECLCPGGMYPGQFTARMISGFRGRPNHFDHFSGYRRTIDIQHVDHTGTSLTQPPESGSFRSGSIR